MACSRSCSAVECRLGLGRPDRLELIRFKRLSQSHHHVMGWFAEGMWKKRRIWMMKRRLARMAYASQRNEDILAPKAGPAPRANGLPDGVERIHP